MMSPGFIDSSSIQQLAVRSYASLEKHHKGMRYSPETYTKSQLNALRIISIVSSSTSILACLITFYTYLAIHPSRKKFRHQLIIFLIIFDFLKALAILLYPILSLVKNTAQIGPKTINFLGFFTALSIEGGDLAILSFAINTLLTIFYPRRTGGLYFIRYYIYVLSIVGPAILASLAFINNVGYVELDIWCYMPERPKWYRLALSWGPRYGIMLAILIIYCTIYFYIISQLKKLESQQREQSRAMTNNTSTTNHNDFNINLQFGNEEKLKTRYKVIARQTKVIFLYPLAYFFLWIFPLVSNSLRLELKSNYPISVLVGFMQSFNGTVDTLVYLYREKPWKLTYSNTPKSPFAPDEQIPQWRKLLRWLPLYELPEESAKKDTTTGKVVNYELNNNMLNSLNPQEFLNMENEKDIEGNVEIGISDSSNCTSSQLKQQSGSDQDGSLGSDDEIDLLDFLNKGPV